jgi:hypothetical protein
MFTAKLTILACSKCQCEYSEIIATTNNYADCGAHVSTTVRHQCISPACRHVFEKTTTSLLWKKLVI